jgi:hypothetical protein
LDEVINTFSGSITRYEEEVLKSLLGYQLYETFIAIVDLGEPYPAIWDDFINGAEFTFEFDGNTITQKWNGLVNTDLISVISYYVYYKYRYENLSTTTSINDVQGIAENAIKVNDTRKMVYAWNKGIELYGELYGRIPEWNFFNKYSSEYEFYNDKPSAFNFLNANRTDYPEWVFRPLKRLNEFGI